mgnify:CR=1 FL=1
MGDIKEDGRGLWKKHGMSTTTEYYSWQHMIQRCYYPKDKRYHRYGGRGIVVCNRWKDSFADFIDDMGLKPFSKAQIDRIDNGGNYEPGNCRWVTSKVNNRNRDTTKLSLVKANKIRQLYNNADITEKELGLRYNVTETTISHVVNNKTWRGE